ncbi:MAG: DUF481 domain-containing protein, partial [Steroidobacteraceae bacterium]|nr:DUF481 domain-containing protein [Steroidobacteraceae bacterium]
MASGNTDTESANVKLDLARDSDRWKHAVSAFAVRGASDDVTTVDRYGGGWQSDYKLSTVGFWFGNLRYERD